jgi:hypothetical protein
MVLTCRSTWEGTAGLQQSNRAEELERVGGTPLFQYIVTTTTAPRAEFREPPYLQLKVYGDPPVKRLLGVDL